MAVVVWSVYYLRRHTAELHLITTVWVPAVVLLLTAKVALFLLNTLQLKVQVDEAGLRMTYAQCFSVNRVTQFTNLVVPVAGGAPVKAVYLNRVYGLPYTAFVALMTVANIMKLLVGSLYALLLLLPVGSRAAPLISLAAALLTAALVFLLVMHRIPGQALAFWPWAARLAAEWRVLRSNSRLLRRLALLNILVFLLASVDVWVSFRAFAILVSFAACGTTSALSSLSAIPNLVPGNLGIREFIFVTIADLHGTGLNASLHAVALNRIAGMLITFLLATWPIPRIWSKREPVSRNS